MTKRTGQAGSRAHVLETLARVGRENSDATVLFHAAVASYLGLHPTDYKVLGIIEQRGALNAREISEHTGLAPASVTDLIDRLERKGYVQRAPDPHDRRCIRVTPAEQWLAAPRSLLESTRRSVARLFERYSDSELRVIADFLARNAERLRAETKKLGIAATDRRIQQSA